MFVYENLQKAIDDTFSKQLFFIIGVAKSGTTWLQITLDGHPEIACRGEGHFTNYLAPNLEKAVDRYNTLIDGKNKTIFTEIEGFPLLKRDHVLFLLASAIGLQMAEYGKGNSIRVIGEKTPDNIHALPALRELFPDAKFFHIIRDGRDAAVSAWFHNFRVAPDLARKTLGTLPRFAEKFARAWVKAVKAGRAFGKQHPRQYLEVRYEDLHQDTAGSVLRALEFLDVDASEQVITRCLDAGSFETFAGGRKPGEENRESLFRKGGVGDWRNHFDSRATEGFERHAGDLLRQLGYT